MKRRTFLGGIVSGLTALFTRQPAQAIDENGEVREFMGKTWIITKKPGLVEPVKNYILDAKPKPRYFTATPVVLRYMNCASCQHREGMFDLFATDPSISITVRQERCSTRDRIDTSGDVFIRGRCQACKRLVYWTVDTVYDKDYTVQEFDPDEIIERVEPLTGVTKYFWRIPRSFRQHILDGDVYLHAMTHSQIIKAIIDDAGFFAFDPGRLFKLNICQGVIPTAEMLHAMREIQLADAAING